MMVKLAISVVKRFLITRLIITGLCLRKRDEWYPQRLLVGLVSKCVFMSVLMFMVPAS